uniref:Lymphocyte transmembrane adaptor 1 n=1 Tax=Mus musculus TaxID=10090 RepID=A0A087WQ47_MOUSE
MYSTPAPPEVTRRNSEPSTRQGTLGSLQGPPKPMVPFRCIECPFILWSIQ